MKCGNDRCLKCGPNHNCKSILDERYFCPDRVSFDDLDPAINAFTEDIMSDDVIDPEVIKVCVEIPKPTDNAFEGLDV